MTNAYVYKIVNNITNEYYIGFRCQNQKLNLDPIDDLWKTYFTSSKHVAKLIKKFGKDSFRYEVIFEHAEIDICFRHEQKIISEHIGDPLILNKRCFSEQSEIFLCTGHSEETIQKLIKVAKSPEVVAKRENTFMERYGVTHNSKIPNLRKNQKEKEKETLRRKYGVEHNMHIPGVVESMTKNRDKTMIERYGTTNALKNPEILEKQQKTLKKYWKDNFGVVNPLQVPEILQKQQETTRKVLMEKYGVTHNSQIKVTCPHCGSIVNVTARNKKHFDNCKEKDKNHE